MGAISRILANAASVPVGMAATAAHRMACGPAAVLDVLVKGTGDVMRRAERVHRLRRVAWDDNVAAVLLRLDAPPGNYAACSDLRNAIAAIRRAGKPVYAYLETPGNATMWIASACDEIFVLPTAEVGMVGLGVEMTFFGTALERLGLIPDFEAAGAYKSFGEPWTRSFPSVANQEAMGELIEDLQAAMLEDVAAGRGLEVGDVRGALANSPMSAVQAVDLGLIDQLKYEDELLTWLDEQHGSASKQLEFETWALRDAWIESIEAWGDGEQVLAVVHLQGPIVMDAQGPMRTVVAARKVVPILRKLREDDKVSAVVLHVNSPGGSVVASDLIWREVEATRHAKPVVACFEDVAASGGVYLSAPANEIVARPTTLTGSIGVFGGKVVAGEGMRKLGVHVHEVAEAPNANMFTPHRRFTEGQRERFRSYLQRTYDGFVGRVAEGRDAEASEIEPHCRGRVWTGRHAMERGLIDHFGDLHDAVERARGLAGLHHGGFRRVDLEGDPKTYAQKMVKQAVQSDSAAAAALAHVFPAAMLPIATLVLERPSEAIAMLPWDITLR